MMKTIKAIETKYKGYKFRSRLEARWAVFFDAAKIKWQYETEGFEDKEGNRYLPDFYLPDYDMHVEVKGEHENYKKELLRALSFVTYGGPIKKLLVLGNIPEYQNKMPAFPVFHYDIWAEEPATRYLPMLIYKDETHWHHIANWAYKYASDFLEDAPKYRQGFDFLVYYPKCWIDDDNQASDYDAAESTIECRERLNKCLDKARQARFEYGEKGGE